MHTILVPRSSAALRYVLVERLGRGGVGETWRARREGGLVPQEVCIKRPLLPLDEERRRAFVEEARLLSRIRHGNVVSLLEASLDESGHPFLVLELVDGADLRHMSRFLRERQRRSSPNAVAAVGSAVCRALAAAQRAWPSGFVHRDVTPHNILVSVAGELKLADFGIGRAFDRESWTRAGFVKGKIAYVSPEQVRGERLDVRSDLFALGIVLYELLAGRRPFEGDGRLQTLRAIQSGQRAPLSALAAHAPCALIDAVETLLCSQPDERPASAQAAWRLFSALGDEASAAVELAKAVHAARRPGLAKTVAVRPMRVDDLCVRG